MNPNSSFRLPTSSFVGSDGRGSAGFTSSSQRKLLPYELRLLRQYLRHGFNIEVLYLDDSTSFDSAYPDQSSPTDIENGIPVELRVNFNSFSFWELSRLQVWWDCCRKPKQLTPTFPISSRTHVALDKKKGSIRLRSDGPDSYSVEFIPENPYVCDATFRGLIEEARFVEEFVFLGGPLVFRFESRSAASSKLSILSHDGKDHVRTAFREESPQLVSPREPAPLHRSVSFVDDSRHQNEELYGFRNSPDPIPLRQAPLALTGRVESPSSLVRSDNERTLTPIEPVRSQFDHFHDGRSSPLVEGRRRHHVGYSSGHHDPVLPLSQLPEKEFSSSSSTSIIRQFGNGRISPMPEYNSPSSPKYPLPAPPPRAAPSLYVGEEENTHPISLSRGLDSTLPSLSQSHSGSTVVPGTPKHSDPLGRSFHGIPDPSEDSSFPGSRQTVSFDAAREAIQRAKDSAERAKLAVSKTSISKPSQIVSPFSSPIEPIPNLQKSFSSLSSTPWNQRNIIQNTNLDGGRSGIGRSSSSPNGLDLAIPFSMPDHRYPDFDRAPTLTTPSSDTIGSAFPLMNSEERVKSSLHEVMEVGAKSSFSNSSYETYSSTALPSSSKNAQHPPAQAFSNLSWNSTAAPHRPTTPLAIRMARKASARRIAIGTDNSDPHVVVGLGRISPSSSSSIPHEESKTAATKDSRSLHWPSDALPPFEEVSLSHMEQHSSDLIPSNSTAAAEAAQRLRTAFSFDTVSSRRMEHSRHSLRQDELNSVSLRNRMSSPLFPFPSPSPRRTLMETSSFDSTLSADGDMNENEKSAPLNRTIVPRLDLRGFGVNSVDD